MIRFWFILNGCFGFINLHYYFKTGMVLSLLVGIFNLYIAYDLYKRGNL